MDIYFIIIIQIFAFINVNSLDLSNFLKCGKPKINIFFVYFFVIYLFMLKYISLLTLISLY